MTKSLYVNQKPEPIFPLSFKIEEDGYGFGLWVKPSYYKTEINRVWTGWTTRLDLVSFERISTGPYLAVVKRQSKTPFVSKKWRDVLPYKFPSRESLESFKNTLKPFSCDIDVVIPEWKE